MTFEKLKGIKIILILVFSYIFLLPCYAEFYHLDLYTSTQSNSNEQTNFDEILINNSNSYDDSRLNTALVQLSSAEFKDIFQKAPDEYEILRYLELFAFPFFRSYVSSLCCYEDFMIALQAKINNDKCFRKQTAKMPGFNCSYSIWSGTKSEFHDFINNEADRILKIREEKNKKLYENQPRLCIADRSSLEILKLSYAKSHNSADKNIINRLRQRTEAINKTLSGNGSCFDYSSRVKHTKFNDANADVFDNCYGTELDKQLHEELCQTRTQMMQLETSHPDIIQIKTISPVVYHFTALAKQQTNPEVAFHISDFCHHLTQTAQAFGNASLIVFKGLGKGVINTVEHNIAFCQSLATHPIDEVIKPLYRAGAALGKAMYCASELAINDPENFNKKAKGLILAAGKYVYENPEDAIAAVVECLLPIQAGRLVKLKQVQVLVKAVQEQEALARAIQISTKITTPIKEVLSDACAAAEIGIQYGKNALNNVIRVALQQPELISVGDIAALRIPSECFNDFNKLSKEVVNYRKFQGISKKAELLKTGENGTTVIVRNRTEAEILLKASFPDYQKVKGIGHQNAAGIRKKQKMDRYKQGGAYHKDYAIDQKTGWVKGHENSKHGEYPHINIKRTDGKNVMINIIEK